MIVETDDIDIFVPKVLNLLKNQNINVNVIKEFLSDKIIFAIFLINFHFNVDKFWYRKIKIKNF